MEKIFKAIGDYSRVRIINLLISGRLCVTELSNVLQMSISAVSRHLSRLNLVGIIEDKHEAQWVYYEVSKEFAANNSLLLDYIQKVAETDSMLKDDAIRLQRYKSSEYCCKDLTACKVEVEKIMGGNNE
ncbi:MAG: metalloregulator ArsR/SmtB family transcription factor [Eubacteriales bacterium]